LDGAKITASTSKFVERLRDGRAFISPRLAIDRFRQVRARRWNATLSKERVGDEEARIAPQKSVSWFK